MNKNVLLKGKLGADQVALLAAFKSWFNPSLAGALAAQYSFKTNTTRFGLTVQVRGCGVQAKGGGGEGMLRGCCHLLPLDHANTLLLYPHTLCHPYPWPR